MAHVDIVGFQAVSTVYLKIIYRLIVWNVRRDSPLMEVESVLVQMDNTSLMDHVRLVLILLSMVNAEHVPLTTAYRVREDLQLVISVLMFSLQRLIMRVIVSADMRVRHLMNMVIVLSAMLLDVGHVKLMTSNLIDVLSVWMIVLVLLMGSVCVLMDKGSSTMDIVLHAMLWDVRSVRMVRLIYVGFVWVLHRLM
jgi:hypothetical protein